MAIKRTILSLLCAAAAAAATAQTNDADSIGTPDVLMAEVVEVPDTTAQTAAVKPSRLAPLHISRPPGPLSNSDGVFFFEKKKSGCANLDISLCLINDFCGYATTRS